MYYEEKVLASLIQNGFAQDLNQATRILEEINAKQRRADMLIIYHDFKKVRQHFGKHLVDEKPYNYSEVRVAKVASGLMGKLKNDRIPDGAMAIGKIAELVSKPRGKNRRQVKLGAFVKEFPYQGKGGIFFDPYSAKATHARGNKTVGERENLFRIEFKRIGGDFVLGMFQAWKSQPISETTALVLVYPKASTIYL